MSTLAQTSSFGNCVKTICILPSGTVANTAIPALSTDGVPTYPSRGVADGTGLCFPNVPARKATLAIAGSCTAGQVLVGTFTMWGYHPVMDKWFEIPVNGGTPVTPVALAETDTDKITFTQNFDNLGHWSRLALQLTAVGGAGATFEAWLTTEQEIG